ncbi:tetratricopeptide repeat protein [Chlorobium ferrooxidans]|uniref:TPR repeat n=1 Tax=Chlorobium ferrooxidans DSM 13031 TaxID=377431 RepID=Q0YPR3_9CHLB|nr:tetratricopeptide repeat protein [Chlorobium ferrooxidans]EAT58286.1 TPR repeat [Chlorobium ferrooxidans DSM 13031]
MTRCFVKYNPAFLEVAQLVENFVVRQIDLEMIVRIISDNGINANQHVLVIGPRGSGKTTLVHRIATEITQHEELSICWYPLIFSEESYQVSSASEFWLEALFHLGEQTGDQKWKRTYDDLRKEKDDKKLCERALWQILDFADSEGKKILLIVENLNMLFRDLNSKDEAWNIRHTLINEPRLMLLATATSRFEGIDHLSNAMFEMFKIHELKPLDDNESNAIWELITGEKLPGEQIRPVRILTGGNPRLLSILAKFGAKRSFRQLLDDLIDLIDEHTDYFKSHLDAMAPIERKVYLAIAELWDISLAREIALVARIDVNKTSSLLNRLVSRGAVVVEEQGKRSKLYRVAEGIYNIYYLMRRRGKPADRVKAAVKFMVSLYGPSSAVNLLVDETSKMGTEQCREHFIAYDQIVKNVDDQELRERIVMSTPKSFLDSPFLGEIAGNYLAGGRQYESKNLNSIDVEIELKAISKILDNGYDLFKDQNYSQAIIVLDDLISVYKARTEFGIVVEVARAMFNKGITLGKLNRPEEEVQAYDDLIAMYRECPEFDIAVYVASALFNKGLPLSQLNRPEEEVQVYDDLVAMYRERSEVEIAVYIARALFSKGMALGELNRIEEEVVAYDNLIAMYRDRPEAEIVEPVAMALLSKGITLGKLNRPEEEMQVYDDLITMYRERTESEIAVHVASALFNRGLTLGKLNRTEEEVVAYDDLISMYRDRPEEEIVEAVAMALSSKGITLGKLNRPEEEMQVYDDLVALYGERTELDIVVEVARALFNKGITLGKLNRPEEEVVAYDDLISMYRDRPEAEIAVRVVRAILNKGFKLGELNRPEEELQVYDDLVAMYRERSEVEIAVYIARALFSKGMALGELNRTEEKVQVYDDLISMYRDRPEAEIVEPVAMALLSKGITLGKLNRTEEEVQVYDDLIAIYRDRSEVKVAVLVARALISKGITLGQLNRPEEEVQVYDDLVALYGERTEFDLAVEVSRAMFNKGIVLDNFERYQEAESVFTRVIEQKSDFVEAYFELLQLFLKIPGRENDAFTVVRKYVFQPNLVQKSIEDAIAMFVELAASGYAKEALDILVDSPSEQHLEPLVVALRLHTGQEVKSSVEILEVAKDVVKRIEERHKAMQSIDRGEVVSAAEVREG